jgi:geranylgeranyl diphosphate synthase type II
MSEQSLENQIQKGITLINTELTRCLRKYPHRTEELLETGLYCVGCRGHRWRPFLFLKLLYKLHPSAQQSSALSVACAIELLHSASIILDDLPAMDDAAMRRGKKPSHLEFNEARAILTACWLCDVAQHCLHVFRPHPPFKGDSDLEDMFRKTKNRLMQGQIRDLETIARSEKEILRTYEMKSGFFFGFVAGTPAKLLGMNKLAIHLEKFGKFLGIAYQISDDIADQTATSKQLGKDVHKDDAKPTLPKKYGLQRAVALRKFYYDKSIAELKYLPGSTNDLAELASKIIFMG